MVKNDNIIINSWGDLYSMTISNYKKFLKETIDNNCEYVSPGLYGNFIGVINQTITDFNKSQFEDALKECE